MRVQLPYQVDGTEDIINITGHTVVGPLCCTVVHEDCSVVDY